MSGHTAEPWVDFGFYQVGKDGFVIANVLAGNVPSGIEKETKLANARRIVACVNACSGIETVTLESLAGTENPTLKSAATAIERAAMLERQRDQLLAALKLMEEEKSNYMRINNLGDPSKEYTNKIARAVIAAAEG